ncbi:MAG: PAS domain S-box protein [Burkholderiales bacterium]|nr:PAS domain S-box protein [Burkholderiales bacterium]
MRLNKGYLLISVAIVLGVLATVAWYFHRVEEAKKQHVLQQAAQKYFEQEKAAQATAAGEAHAAAQARTEHSGPAALAGDARPRMAQGSPQASGGPSFSQVPESPLLSTALLLTALTALGLGGSTYRLAKQKGRVLLERDRLAQELDHARAADASSPGRPAPPWQETALMMVRASAAPAIAYDLDARVLEVSEAVTRLTGYTRIDIPDVKSWLTKALRIPDSELDAALESFRGKVHGGDIETQTVWARGGEARTWLCQPLEVWPLEGDALLLVARATDVTEQTDAVRTAREEAACLRLAVADAERRAGVQAPAPAASARETELAAQLARRDQECQGLTAQMRVLNERLSAQQAQLAELPAREADVAHASAALAQDQRQRRVVPPTEDAERFLHFAEQFEDSLWLADPRVPRLIYAGPQAAKLRLRPLARMLEDFSEWTAAVHEDDRERVRQAFAGAAVEGRYDVEYRVVREDRGVVWLHDRGTAVHDAQKRLRYIAGITADVTLRRNADDLMRSSLATLKTVVDCAPAMVWLKDAQGRYLFANREHERLTGLSGEQLRGMTDFQVFPRGLAERMHENDARARSAKTAQQFDETLQLADGLHHYIALKFPARPADTASGALCGIAIDITERRRGDDALRAAESRYRAICAALPEPLLIARENKLVYANAAAARLLGTTDGEALAGTALAQLGTGLAEHAKTLTAEEAGARRFVTRLKARDGRELDAEVSAASYETATERAVQFVVQDASARNARLRAERAQRDDLAAILDRCPALVWVADASDRGYFNRACLAWLGGKTEEDVALDLRTCLHPEEREGWLQRRAQHQREGTPFHGDFRLRRYDGEFRRVHITALPLASPGGADTRFVGAIEDITEQRQTAEALGVADQRLAAVTRLLSASPGDGLTQVRQTARMALVMFPGEAALEQASAKVLSEAGRLEGSVGELIAKLRAQQGLRT